MTTTRAIEVTDHEHLILSAGASTWVLAGDPDTTDQAETLLRHHIDDKDAQELGLYLARFDKIQAGTSDDDSVTIEADTRRRLDISVQDARGYGHGHRLTGPKHNDGGGTPTLRYVLTDAGAEALRQFLGTAPAN